MPVYLVASRQIEDPETKRGALEELFRTWARSVKGEVDHIELAFVNPGRPIRGFGITARSKTTKFGQRIYDETIQRAKFTWYLIPDIDEKKCEAYCESRVGKDRMSLARMTMSGLPFQNETVVKWVTPFVSGVRPPPPGTKSPPQEEEPDDPYAENAAFCSTTTLRALRAGTNKLGDVGDPYALTANDVLVLAVRRLGAVKTSTPPMDPKHPAALVEELGVVRSDRWV